MRKRKGVVPVIATILLIAIVCATVLVVFAYVSGATVLPDTDQQVGRMVERLKTVEVKAYMDGQFHVFIMNTGSVDSVIDMFYVTGSSGDTILTIPVSASVDVGQTVRFDFDPYISGTSPWSWYEIMGVTQRGTKVTASLYGYFTGAYELGEGPKSYPAGNGSMITEVDYPYSVYNVTIDGTPTSAPNLQNLTSIDGNYFGFPATNWSDSVGTYPFAAYELDFNSNQYITHGEDIVDLTNYGSSTVWHFNMHPHSSVYSLSAEFNGIVTNLKYPKIAVTFIFDLQNSGWSTLNGTMQFYNWTEGQFATSGSSGYVEFNGTSIANASSPPAVLGYKNLTLVVTSSDIIGENGEWRFIINMTNTQNDNLKLDYLTIKEEGTFVHYFETIFWFKANSVAYEENVTQLTFSTTGIFPDSAPSYWFAVYNFDTKNWYYPGQILGSPILQTSVFQIDGSCSSYMENGSKNVVCRIVPSVDLPSLQMIYIDQARLIVRQLEYH